MGFDVTRLTTEVGGKEIIIETGRMANQADGAVWIQCGGTVVLVTVVTQTLEREVDFMPLVVDYQERSYSAGRIPGGYFRREIGRPSERETLVSRLIDRPIRPLFPKGFRDEVQVIATVLSSDQVNDPDILAVTGASAAMHMSSVPFLGPIVGARVGYIDGNFVLNPSAEDMGRSNLNMVIAASRDAVVMVEGGADFLHEDILAEAIIWAHKQVQPLIDLQHKLRETVGKPKLEFEAPVSDPELAGVVRELATGPLTEALFIPEKMARRSGKKAAKKAVVEQVKERFADQEINPKKVGEILDSLEKQIVRRRILDTGRRIDGRDLTSVRQLTAEVGLLPRTHGSTLFARGETKVLAIATLGSTGDEQKIESLMGDSTKRFMLHYNFPPYCVGEVKMLRGPARREIGHGALAERSIAKVLPDAGEFPFTMRIVAECMESNGSSSMASVCGASLALMDAGVPIATHVAGIAMGLIKEDDQFLVLTDILGDEDALGDMDFKVAGTREGVTGIQMDIKIAGIPAEVLKKALGQAREARMQILDYMESVLSGPRPELSPHAPQLVVVEITPEKIREVIGPGGKNIKAITAATGASIDIEDSGRVSIFAPTSESLERAKAMVLHYDQKAELGRNYVGKVKKIVDCGAVVEILPGLEGLVHVSQLDMERVENVTDVVRLGQEINVKVIEVEPSGRTRLSRKAWLMEQAGQEVDLTQFSKPSGGRDRDRGDRPRGDYRGGGRDRDRGPRR